MRPVSNFLIMQLSNSRDRYDTGFDRLYLCAEAYCGRTYGGSCKILICNCHNAENIVHSHL